MEPAESQDSLEFMLQMLEKLAPCSNKIDDEEQSQKVNGVGLDNNLVVEEPRSAQQIKGNCVNLKCATANDLIVSPPFISNFYNQNLSSSKKYYVCVACYDSAIGKYEEYCSALKSGQALLQEELPVNEDILMLSDESDDENDRVVVDPGDTKLSAGAIELVSNELEDIINEQFARINMDQQASWCKQLLEAKIDNNNKMIKEVTDDLDHIDQRLFEMNKQLYSLTGPTRVSLPELDIISMPTNGLYRERYELPTTGSAMPRPAMTIGTNFYGVKEQLLSAWTECKILDPIDGKVDDFSHFKVEFLDSKVEQTLPGKFLAYAHPSPVRLRAGDRVIALSRQDTEASHFFPGIIGEPLQKYNNCRYLVFFDDGHAQYASHQDVRLVYEVSTNVCDDLHDHAKDFIREYLLNYRKERPLIHVKKDQRLSVEYEGVWHQARVMQMDASLMYVRFESTQHCEWIYRGSPRLGAIYREKSQKNLSSAPKRHQVYVDYIILDDDDEQSSIFKCSEPNNNSTQPKAIARKNTQPVPQQIVPKIENLANTTIIIDDDVEKGKVVYYNAQKNYKPPEFTTHQCNPKCLYKSKAAIPPRSSISKPHFYGWERMIIKNNRRPDVIMYKSPCGRRLRNISEVHRYLCMTKCNLGIECFDFDLHVHTLGEYVVTNPIYSSSDISEGQEGIPVAVVNYFDDTKPPPMEYSAQRIATSSVNLNLDENFLCGCDCKDDCLDKSKCACQMLTADAAKFGNPDLSPNQVGYQFKRLHEQMNMGIYECNSQCKCSKSCLNRVVQLPISNKLVLYKTNNKGWGLRAVTDIPKGSFICNYSGYLLSEEKANEYGALHGDTYFADLDYIEMAERTKQGYESDAAEMTDESTDDERALKDRLEKRLKRHSTPLLNKATKKAKKSHSSTETDENRKRITLVPGQMGNADDIPEVEENENSLRKLYGKDECVYVLDAKIAGNIGRYFNHSCEPNMLVQNVFVDTHDLRFPWISFFANFYIRAGTELTWDYNYAVGSVPGKVLYCQCGAENCRGRIL